MATEIAALEAPVIHDAVPAPHHFVRSARAILEQGQYSWIWVVLACPYCGKPHDHYGGPLDGTPYRYVGQTFPARCDRAARRSLLISDPKAALWYMLIAGPPPRGAAQREG
jgi:hypothetical protein